MKQPELGYSKKGLTAEFRYAVIVDGVSMPCIVDRKGKVLYHGEAQTMRELVEMAIVSKVSLKNAELLGANLKGADLRGADLESADLRFANIRNADCTGANLKKARVDGLRLKGSIINGCTCTEDHMGDD